MQKQDSWRRTLLRTEETAARYEQAQATSPSDTGCRLCNDLETIVEYKHWRLAPNKFPYDRFFSKSHMLVSSRHVDENGLNIEEKAELIELKNNVLSDGYDIILENLPKQKSIPHHMHYHLVEIKKPD